MVVLSLIFWGTYSLTQLPIDALPDITNNQVQVITIAPTLASQEVEQFITYPIEKALATIPGLTEQRSLSRMGLSLITVVFDEDMDIYKARQLVDEKIKEAEKLIPPGAGTPEMAPVSTGLGEIYQYLLQVKPEYTGKYSLTDLRTFQDWIVKPQLLGTPGIAEVSSIGGMIKQYEVSVNPEKIRSVGITLTEIFDALQKDNENTGGAYIDKKPDAYFIRGLGLIKTKQDIEKIVIKMVSGVPVTIGDVANVGFGHATRYGAVVYNGREESVGGVIMMLKGENSAQVVERVKEKMQTIEKSLPPGVYIKAFIDRTSLVNRAIGTVSENLLMGGLIVIFILILFLGNLRAGFVVASVIPLSLLFAVSMMRIFGVSGNLMSLGAIDFGLIVDGAVIIVDAVIFRIASRNDTLRRLTNREMDHEVNTAAGKIIHSAAFGVIIIMIVYLPILALVGIEGKMFKPMAETVVFAVLGAFLLSLTYVPMMSALALSREATHKRNISDRLMAFIQKGYDPVIRYAISHKQWIISLAFVLFVAGIWIFTRLGGEFIPTLDEGDLLLLPKIKSGSSLSQTIDMNATMGKILKSRFPEVRDVVAKIGVGEIPTDPTPMEASDVIVALKDKREWVSASSKTELIGKMDKALSELPGVSYEFSQPIEARFNELMTGIRSDIAIKIFGEDLDVLTEKANEAGKYIRNIQGVGAVRVEQVIGLPQIVVEYKRDVLTHYGLHIADINRIVKTAFAGDVAGTVYEGEKRFDLVLRLEPGFRKDISNLRELYVPLPGGGQIALDQVADIHYVNGPQQIARDDGKRRITIGIDVKNRDVQSLVNEIRSTLESRLVLPPGYTITYGGQFQNLVEAKKRLSIAVPAALALILVLLYFTFQSVKQTLLIFTAIPLATIGGVLALLIRGMPFSISAGVGFIALFGVAVLNGIVLISYFNELEKEGVSDITERVLRGTRVRLRPVLMTASVASLGFLPMAISVSAGAEVQKPLATVVIGGLITATLLTLVVLPVLYIIFSRPFSYPGRKGRIATVLLFCALALPSHAQQAVSGSTVRIITLEQAVETGLANNGKVKSAGYDVDMQNALKKSAPGIGKTDVSFTYGQTNSYYRDNEFLLSQQIDFPMAYINRIRLARSKIEGSRKQYDLTRTELKSDITSLYYSLWGLKEKRRLLLEQDSIFSRSGTAAEIGYKTGEVSLLDKTTVQSALMGIRSQLMQNEADIRIARQQLQALINAGEEVDIPDAPLEARILIIPADSSIISGNSTLDLLRQQVIIAKNEKRLENVSLLPDFRVGYFNKSIIGTQNIDGVDRTFNASDRFTGLELGISVPIWFRTQQGKIQAAKLSELKAQNDYEWSQKMIVSRFRGLVEDYIKYGNILGYYRENMLPQSRLIIENSNKSFAAGEIGYFQYIRSLEQALAIQQDYLEKLGSYNQTIIEIEYIMGGN